MPKLATVVTDMLNPYDHEDADALAEQASQRIDALAGLIEASHEGETTLVYVNDNYDDFTVTSEDLLERALEGRHPELIEPIRPPEGSYFVQKVRHSAFYNTFLDHMLGVLEIEAVAFAGQVTEQCVLYSALDAYVRGYEVRIPTDAVVPLDPELGEAAIEMMERNMSARVGPATEILS